MFIPVKECIELSGGFPFKGVIHCGAHHGEEIGDYVNNGVQEVIWIEANKNLMNDLIKNVDRYSDRVEQKCLNYCLSDVDDKEVTFNIANNGHSSSFLEFGKHKELYPHIKWASKVDMITNRFDTVVQREQIDMEKYDFINLDLQGAELLALKGFGNLFDVYKNIRAIYTEVNTEEIYINCAKLKDIKEYLSNFGFGLVTTRMERNDGWGDGIFVR